jgi:hypothetical protein
MPVIVVPRGALSINARMAFGESVRIAAMTNYGDPFAHMSAKQLKVLKNRLSSESFFWPSKTFWSHSMTAMQNLAQGWLLR